MLKKTKLLLVLLLTMLCLVVMAAPYKGKAVILTQYNGTAIEAFEANDGFMTWYQDAGGYAIVKQGDVYVYAQSDGEKLVATEYVVGETDPLFLDLAPFDGFAKVDEQIIPQTTWSSLNGIVYLAPQPIVTGEIKPIVVLCDYKFTDPNNHSNDRYVSIPGEIYAGYDDFWANANDFITQNTPMYKGDEATFRLFAEESLKIEKAVYQYDIEYTFDQIVDRLAASIKGQESQYDINADGFVDKIIFVVANDASVSYGNGRFTEKELGKLKAGSYTVVNPTTFKSPMDMGNSIISGFGQSLVQPISDNGTTLIFFGQNGDSKFDEDGMGVIANGNNGQWNDAAIYLSYFTRNCLTVGGITPCRDGEWKLVASESGDALTIINDGKDGYASNITDYANYDLNNDGYVDRIIVMIPEANYNSVSDYSTYKRKFRNSDLYIGKVIMLSPSTFTGKNIATNMLNLSNYMSLSRETYGGYAPVGDLDALGGLGKYDFLPVNIYSQKQAGYLAAYGETDARLGIGTINKDNCIFSNGKPVTFKLQRNISDPSKKVKIAYKIQTSVNPDEEFWVEYRVSPLSVGSTEVFNKQEDGLYVYRVVKSREGFGNYYAGQKEGEYIPDEVYYFRTDGESDYGVDIPGSNLNGIPAQANIGVYGRYEFGYDTNPRAFFSNGRNDCGFRIYNVQLEEDGTMSFNVAYTAAPPRVVSFVPGNVNHEADSSKFVNFKASYQNESGSVSLWKANVKWDYVFGYTNGNVLDLCFDNAHKTITMKDCLVENERGTFDVKDLTCNIGEKDAYGNDVIIANKYFQLNVSQASWAYTDDKLFITYPIAPTEYFVSEECFDQIYFDSDKITVSMSAKTFDGNQTVDLDGGNWSVVTTEGYTKLTPSVIFESASPVDYEDKDYFIDNLKLKASYTKGGENIEHIGTIYNHSDSDKSIMFDYIPNLISEETYTYETVDEGNYISADFKISAAGLLGAYLEGYEVKDTSFAVTDYSIEIEKITTQAPYDVEELIKKFVEEEGFDYLSEKIEEIFPEVTVFDWSGQILGKDSMIIANGLVTVPTSGFSISTSGKEKTLDVAFEFDAAKTPVTFNEPKSYNIMFSVYGFASIEKDFYDFWEDILEGEAVKETDYKYAGYYGIGYNQDYKNPVITNVSISPAPIENDNISSYVLQFDTNINYKVTYKPAKDKSKQEVPISDITFRMYDRASKDQLFIKYNPLNRKFYAYKWVSDEWVVSEFDQERNINIGEFTIPCYCFIAPEDNGDGTYSFTFVARSKARFTDNPLTIEATVSDKYGNISNPWNSYVLKQQEFIFRGSTGNVIPSIKSIDPSKGTIKTQSAKDFVLKVTDQDGISDICDVYLILSYGGVDECKVKYNYPTGTASLLTKDGWTSAYKLGSNNQVSNTNFTLDFSKSGFKVLGTDEGNLTLNIIPLSAFSGNDVSVYGKVTDVSVNSENLDKYVEKKFGAINFTTSDPKAVMLNATKIALNKSETYNLKVVNGEGDVVKANWTSANNDIATVSVNGKVTAIAPGATKVCATVDGKVLSCSVKVKAPEIEYTGSDYTVSEKVVKETFINNRPNIYQSFETGETVKVETPISESNKETVKSNTVKASEKSGKQISESVEATANIGGINGHSTGGKHHASTNGNSGKSSSKNNVTVAGPVTNVPTYNPVCAVKLSESSLVIEKGGKVALKGITEKGNVDNTLTWSISNSKVAEISNGVVLAKTVGSVTVKAVTVEGKVLSCKVKVIAPQTGKSVKLSVGQSFKLNYVNPTSWKTTNPKVATVNERGVIKALKSGIADVVCTANGKTIKSQIEVK